MADAAQAIKEFIIREFMGNQRDAVLDDDTPLIADGIIDSLGIFVVVSFLEKDFGIKLQPEDVVLDNFESVNTIRDLIALRSGSGRSS